MGESHEKLVVSKDLAVCRGDEAIFSQMSTIVILLMEDILHRLACIKPCK